MINDKIKNIRLYQGIHKNLDAAIDFLSNGGLDGLPLGRTDIKGDVIYAIVLEQTTRLDEDFEMEAHVQYTDIHCPLEGSEVIETAEISTMVPVKPYSAKNDCLFIKGVSMARCRLVPGDFMVCFPTDAHAGCIADEKPMEIKKAILKVKMD